MFLVYMQLIDFRALKQTVYLIFSNKLYIYSNNRGREAQKGGYKHQALWNTQLHRQIQVFTLTVLFRTIVSPIISGSIRSIKM
jgi:hypothetical protein